MIAQTIQRLCRDCLPAWRSTHFISAPLSNFLTDPVEYIESGSAILTVLRSRSCEWTEKTPGTFSAFIRCDRLPLYVAEYVWRYNHRCLSVDD